MKRKRRLYLQYVENSLVSIKSAIDAFNRVYDKHKIGTTLILLTKAWELLGKAILIRKKLSITRDKKGHSYSAEEVILKLVHLQIIDSNQADHIQQVISFRNEAIHGVLPKVPMEILHHLFYFSCKFYKDVINKHFKRYSKQIAANYLSMSFKNLTTYSDKVQKLVGKLRREKGEGRRLVWLLERGIRFDGSEYMSQAEFEKEYVLKKKRKILPHLKLSEFLKKAEMVRIVPVQAPKNFTADIILRKGSKRDGSLPVQIKKTLIETEYPYLTSDIAVRLGCSTNFVSKCADVLNLKGSMEYHQAIRSSKSGHVQRYSQKAFKYLKNYLEKNPNFNPYKKNKEK